MTEKIKLALIASGTVLAAAGLLSYCSPYQTCVRASTAQQLAEDAEYFESGAVAAEAGAEAAVAEFDGRPFLEPEVEERPPLSEETARRRAQFACLKLAGG